MGEIKLVTSIVMITVFTIAILSFMFNFATDNTSAVSINDDPAFTTLNASIRSDMTQLTVSDINDTQATFMKSSVETGDTTLKSGATFKFGISTMKDMMLKIVNLVSEKIFGGSSTSFSIVIGGAFLFMVVFLFVRYGIKTWIGGNPD